MANDGRSAYRLWLDEGYEGSVYDFFAWLKGKPGKDGPPGKSAYEVLGAYREKRLGGMYSIPQLLRDGRVLPDQEPVDLLARPGSYNRVPVVLGTNRDENKLFLAFDSPYVTRVFGMTPVREARVSSMPTPISSFL